MNRALAVLSFFAVSVAAPAFGDELVAEVRTHASYPFHPSFDVVSDSNVLAGFDFGVGWEWETLGDLRTLLVFQTSAPGRLEASLFGSDANLEWGRQRALAVLDWGVRPWEWFRPFIRGGLGYSHQYLSITTVGPRRKDHAHDLGGFGSGGVQFDYPLSFGGLGLSSELGYTFQTPATFDELRHDRDAFEDEFEDEEEGDPWTRENSSLGTLHTNGVFWDIGLHFRVAF